jgi:hypothetical protein
MCAASAKTLQQRLNYWESRLALEAPVLKLCAGGLISVHTNAANEVQLRLTSNLATLYRRDRHKPVVSTPKVRNGSLVYSRISQTDTTSGEIQGTTRDRKFSGRARHMIREGGGVLDEVYSKNCWFLTLTLPGSTVQAVEAFAKFDKEIKNAFLQNFRKVFAKVFPRGGADLDYLCVSELQERGGIHFHIALGWASDRFARIVKRCYRRWWHKILLRYSAKSGVDLCERDGGGTWRELPQNFLLECEQVEHSVGAYLSKYLSKAASKDGRPGINSPSRWWSVSKPLRQKIELARESQSTSFTTYADAQSQIKQAADTLIAAGFELRQMTSRWCDQFLGFICFPEPGKRIHLFEYSKLLCTTSGAKAWDERSTLYAWDDFWNENEGDYQNGKVEAG